MKQPDLFPPPAPPRPEPRRYDLPDGYGEATDWSPRVVPDELRIPLLDDVP